MSARRLDPVTSTVLGETAMAMTEQSAAAVGGRLIGLPMPRNMELCVDQSRRPRARREAGPRFPFPVPNGWFIVARGADLVPGDVVPLHYFGRDLVLFRTDSAAPRLLNAYCAHLGAHLAVGGRVTGDTITCPFHGWCYDGESGKCVEIPYAESGRIPSQARVRSYPTLERNGMIWAWHHLEGKAPFYDVPEVPEFADPEWSEPDVRDFEIATCCQEMAENNHDSSHFKFVHGSPDINWDSHVIEGPYKRTEGFEGSFIRETFGLGLGVLRMKGAFTFISSTTPIDEENVHVRWVFTAPKSAGADSARNAADMLLSGVSQDIPIWENKTYRDRPVLTKEERGIAAHREWCQQFYSDPADAID
jgi:nitrite reductase/ring-hydroxylating ferredoxin subunit